MRMEAWRCGDDPESAGAWRSRGGVDGPASAASHDTAWSRFRGLGHAHATLTIVNVLAGHSPAPHTARLRRTALNRACRLPHDPRAHRLRTDETHARRQTLPLHRRLTTDDTEPWPPFAHHMTPEQPSSTRCMPSHDGQSVPASCSRDYTGDHCPWSRTAHGWVGKRGSQELWTDLAVAVPRSEVNRGGEEMRIDRLR